MTLREDAKVERMRAAVSDALAKLEPYFMHHRLTFVARNTKPGLDADVIIGSDCDNLIEVAAVLTDHAHRNAPYVCPGCYAVAPERCAPGCIDTEMEARRERDDDSYPDHSEDDSE